MDGLRGNFSFGQARDVSGNRITTKPTQGSRAATGGAGQPIGSRHELAHVLEQVTSSIQGGAEPPPFDPGLIQAYKRYAGRNGQGHQG